MRRIFWEIRAERARQDARFGEQNHPDLAGDAETQCDAREMFARYAGNYRDINDGTFDPRDTDPRQDWTGILLEEVYEALAESDPVKLRTELIQTAAVCVAWVEHLDRRALAARCKWCAGEGVVPDLLAPRDHNGYPPPKPCPDCQEEEAG